MRALFFGGFTAGFLSGSGSPIGSGQGLVSIEAIKIIVEQATVPVVVDAGIGVPSDAAQAMEAGADACLVNTAIALAVDRLSSLDEQRASQSLLLEGEEWTPRKVLRRLLWLEWSLGSLALRTMEPLASREA